MNERCLYILWQFLWLILNAVNQQFENLKVYIEKRVDKHMCVYTFIDEHVCKQVIGTI